MLRKRTYRQANYRCQVCGGRGSKHPVECHEIWQYDNEKKIQKLIGLTALCPSCHQVKHIGLAGIQGKAEEAKAHIARVNGWTREETEAYLEGVWSWRSREQWKLDLSWLKHEYGIEVEQKR